MCTSADISTSGLVTAILDLLLPVRSDSIIGITVWLLYPENIRLAVGIALPSYVQNSGDMNTSGVATDILDFSLPVRSDSIVCTTVGLLDPRSIGLAVWIALLSYVQLEFPHEEVVALFTNENGAPSDFSPVVPVVSW